MIRQSRTCVIPERGKNKNSGLEALLNQSSRVLVEDDCSANQTFNKEWTWEFSGDYMWVGLLNADPPRLLCSNRLRLILG